MNTTPFDPTEYDQEASNQTRKFWAFIAVGFVAAIVLGVVLALTRANFAIVMIASLFITIILILAVSDTIFAPERQMNLKARAAAKHFGIYKPDYILLPDSLDNPTVYKDVIASVGDGSKNLVAYDLVTVRKNEDGTFSAEFVQDVQNQE